MHSEHRSLWALSDARIRPIETATLGAHPACDERVFERLTQGRITSRRADWAGTARRYGAAGAVLRERGRLMCAVSNSHSRPARAQPQGAAAGLRLAADKRYLGGARGAAGAGVKPAACRP